MGNNTSKQKLHPKTLAELQEIVDFDKKEIQEWFDEYKRSLAEGERELTKTQFEKVYNSLFAGDATEFAEQIFRTFDTNKNGKVDFKEFLIGLYVSGSSNMETKLKWAFSMYDINQDGFISRSEMQHIISAIFKMTDAPVPADVATPELMTLKFFDEFDINKDGVICWDEFKTAAKSQPVIVNLLECNPHPEETDAD